MIQVTPQMRVLVAVEPADFRRGIDGLAQLCRDSLKVDRFGGVFMFSEIGGGLRLNYWCTTAGAVGSVTSAFRRAGSLSGRLRTMPLLSRWRRTSFRFS